MKMKKREKIRDFQRVKNPLGFFTNKVFKRSGSYFILISKENKILLQQHDPGAFDPRYWSLFGGGIEENETPRHAVIREAKEELGIKLKDFKFFKRYEILKENNWYELFIYTAPLSHSLEQLKSQQREGQGIGLFSYADSKKINISTIVKPIIGDIFDEINKNKISIRLSSFVLRDKKGEVLLQHRGKNTKILPDHWAFFGGKIEENETPKQAVIREAKEELGIAINALRFFRKYKFNVYSSDYEMYIFTAPLANSIKQLKKQQKEGENLGLFSFEETGKLKMHDITKVILKDLFSKKSNSKNT